MSGDAGWWLDHLWYALAWAGFGALHSLLAADAVKDRLKPRFGAWYRMAYNLFATVHLAAVLALGWWVLDGTRFEMPRAAAWAQIAVFVAGAAIFVHALKFYDLARLGGLFQLYQARRGREEPDDEPLRTDGWHRYVRHPLYLGALLILWGGADDPFGLATAVWGSLYLGIGTWFEERKLLRLYGSAYADYRARVPAVLPWRGRAL